MAWLPPELDGLNIDTIAVALLAVVFFMLFVVWFIKSKRLARRAAQAATEIAALRQESAAMRAHYETEAVRARAEADAVAAGAQKQEVEKLQEIQKWADDASKHYEAVAARFFEEAQAGLSDARGRDAQLVEEKQKAEPDTP